MICTENVIVLFVVPVFLFLYSLLEFLAPPSEQCCSLPAAVARIHVLHRYITQSASLKPVPSMFAVC